MTLIERLEAASGPDRELDEAIGLDLGWSPVSNPTFATGLMGRWYTPDGRMTDHYGIPRWTASLDAAMTLIPEGCVTYLASEDRHSHRWEWSLRDKYAVRHHARAPTPALALCIASLKARGVS